jgi:tetratricopeptide (TPR) repeat protein
MPKGASNDQRGGINNPGTINTGGGHVVGRDLTINHGPSAEDVVVALEKRGVLQTAENAGLQRRMVVMLAQRLKPAERLDFEQAITELERAVEIALNVIARGERGSNEDAFVNAVLAEVAEKTRNSDLDGGAKAIDDALAAIDRRETAQRETAQRERFVLLDAAIKQHTLRRDAVAVAKQIERSVAVQHTAERPTWHPDFQARYHEYWEDGAAKGINFSLEVAIECARLTLGAARDADERGFAAVLLGVTLSTLGERESGTARLEEAVSTYRDALQEYTRERVPLNWAGTLNNLGNVLSALGGRESGTTRLEEAVSIYRDALQEYTRELVPLDWATTQNNLADALATLGARESGTARLEEAVSVFRDVLREFTRELMPLRWAGTLSNLGSALATIGARESTFRDALQERERMTLLDAGIKQHTLRRDAVAVARWHPEFRARYDEYQEDGDAKGINFSLEIAIECARRMLGDARDQYERGTAAHLLGNVLQTLGQRESGAARLEDAVAAYHTALTEFSRERVPLDWAMTQNNLGNALGTLAERESGTARVEQAVAAWDACLTVTASVWPSEWVDAVRSRRDKAQANIARRSSRKS